MRFTAHALYTSLLSASFLVIATLIGVRGCSYYLTPLDERPFLAQYEALKPTGFEGHGYGIVGSFLLLAGVGMYAARKRMRTISHWGKISHWLEFHIFLCLTGPTLIVYHSTFKLGGLVAVSFWSMVAVVLSGVIGRYLYVQIPKGIRGNELSAAELEEESRSFTATLEKQYGLDPVYLRAVDAIALPARPASKMSVLEILDFFFVESLSRWNRLRIAYSELERSVNPALIRNVRRVMRRRVVLVRRIAFLGRFKEMFHYWHVVHLPFAIILFVIMCVHIAVAVVFGYTWIW